MRTDQEYRLPATFHLARLERALRLRTEYLGTTNPLGASLLKRSIHSFYVDCIQANALGEANALMRRHKAVP